MKFGRKEKLNELFNSIGDGKIKVIAGLRQVGKSYLLKQLFIPKLIKKLKINKKDIEYLELLYEHAEIRTSISLEKFINDKYKKHKFKYLIIDEIQLAGEGYEDIIKRFHCLNRIVEIFVTGSNSNALSSDLINKYKEHRNIIEVEPLSYNEIIAANKKYSVDDYLTYGGIPRVLNSKDKNKELDLLNKELYQGDLSDRKNYDYLSENRKKRVLTTVYSTINPVSERSLTKDIFKKLGINKIETAKLNKEVGDFLDWCENAYLFKKFENEDYKYNGNEPTVNRNLKYYCIDNGLLNKNYDGGKREEKLLENAVYLELHKLGITPTGSTIQTETGNGEIDFTFLYKGQRFYIQVTHTLKPSDFQREIGNLLNTNKNSQRIIIYKNNLINEIDGSIKKYSINDFIGKIKKIIK